MTEIPLDKQIDTVRPYVQKIREKWADKRNREWDALHDVSDLYEEMGAYVRGLTCGLMQVFNVKDEQSIYNYRDSWRTMLRLQPNADLPYSYFVAINRAQNKYNLSDDVCRDWLEHAGEDSTMSVMDMNIAIERAHTLDARKAFFRRLHRITNSLLTLYQDSESVGIPDAVRVALKSVLDTITECAKMLESIPPPK